jgi:FMN phosphatase YigB (HAD superfamily)
LLDRDAAFRRWAGRFVESEGLPPEAVAMIVELDEDGFAPRTTFFEAIRRSFDVEGTVDDHLARYRDEYPAGFVLDPATTEGLLYLRDAGWRIGVVTNGPFFQERKLDVTGLHELIDGLCISEDVGSNKPEPFIFEEAARRCGTDLDGWMVGDSAFVDIRGGQAVGLRTIWMRRGRDWDPSLPPPDFEADTPREAIDLILGEWA